MNPIDMLEKQERENDLAEKRLWKSLSPSQKHMALMYFYRLETDLEHINDYIETHRFLSYGICVSRFPKFVCSMSPEELYKEAYEVLGLRAPVKRPEQTL